MHGAVVTTGVSGDPLADPKRCNAVVMEEPLDSWFKREILMHEEILMRFLARVWRHRDEVADIRQEAYARVYEAAQQRLPEAPPTRDGATLSWRRRWGAWLRKQRLESTIPTEFSAELDYVVEFADPIIGRQISDGGNWHPRQRQWRNDG